MVELPHTWEMKSCVPEGWDGDHTNKRFVYIILFFERKRTCLMNRSYAHLGTVETRYGQKLLDEAREMGWVTTKWEEYEGGDRIQEYPKKCKIAYWIEYKQECKVCKKLAPLVNGECPDCRH